MNEEIQEPGRRLMSEGMEHEPSLRAFLDASAFRGSEPAAWDALLARRDRSRRAKVGLVSLAAAAVVALGLYSRHESGLVIAAEPVPSPTARGRPASPKAPASPPSAVESAPRPPVTATRRTDLNAAVAMPSAISASPTPLRATGADKVAVEPAPIPAASESSTVTERSHAERPCVDLQRRGDYAGALECFREASLGSGVGAELSLYEAARLQSAALGRPSAALLTLDEHLRRFPQGALTSEAKLMRLGLLVQLQDPRRFAEIEAALGSPLGSERRGELLMLKGNALKQNKRCVEALASYQLALEAGVNAGRVQRAKRGCEGD